MIVRELVTRLGFNADNKAAEKHESTLRKVRNTATALTVAYTATVGALAAVARRMSSTGNEIAKSAQEAGMAADEYQRMRFALGQISQVSDQEADRAMGRLNQRIGRAAREGGKYAEALIDMGFSQEQVAEGTITTSEAMDALTRRMANARNEQEASAIAGDILGTRLGRRLGPALFRNADAMREQQERARDLGGGYSDLATQASEELTDSFAEVAMISRSVSGVIAERLVPAVNSVISSAVDWYVANRELIMQNLGRYLDFLGSALRNIQSVIRFFIDRVNEAVEAMGGWERVIRLVGIALSGLIVFRIARWVWAVSGALLAAAKSGRMFRLALLAIQRIPIIALITGLGLAIEDLITWIMGGDSAIGKWLGTWEDFKKTASDVTDSVLAYIDPLIRQLDALGDIFAGIFTLDVGRIMSGFSNLGAAMLDWALQIGRDLRDAIMSILPDWMVNALESAGGAVSRAASTARQWAGEAVGVVRDVGGWAVENMAGAGNWMMPGAASVADQMQQSHSSRTVNVNARTEAVLQIPQGTPEIQRQALEQQANQIFTERWNEQITRSLYDMPVTE